MLSCPYCQKPVREDDPACPSCSLSVEGASALLGPVPLLNRGLTNPNETLSPKEVSNLKRAITSFESQFPHSQLNIVVQNFDSKFNLSTHLFWLFNTAGLSSQQSKNEDNQDLLLALDTHNDRLGLMVGYGLEPFVQRVDIVALLEAAQTDLEQKKYHTAILTIVTKLPEFLRTACENAHQALGL